jgi:hypothetical protein
MFGNKKLKPTYFLEYVEGDKVSRFEPRCGIEESGWDVLVQHNDKYGNKHFRYSHFTLHLPATIARPKQVPLD